MNDLNRTIIIAILLLAFTSAVFFFKYVGERAHTNTLLLENEAKSAHIELEEQRLIDAERQFEERQRRAKQAKNMLKKTSETKSLKKKSDIETLNIRLEKEADARIKAEIASKELLVQKEVLTNTIADTRKVLEKLQGDIDIPESDLSKKILEYKHLLAEKEKEIDKLKREYEKLEKIYEKAKIKQLATEKEIETKGGKITIPRYKRLLSPNIRSSN